MFKTKTKTFLWCIPEADRRAFFTYGRKRKCRRKWIPLTAENETKTKMDIHFRPKNENETHLIISVFSFLFHTFSHQVRPTMRRQYLVQFRLFCRWSLLTGFHFHFPLCGIFWMTFFNPWTVCFPGLLLSSESNLPQCTVLYWRLCDLTNSPHC